MARTSARAARLAPPAAPAQGTAKGAPAPARPQRRRRPWLLRLLHALLLLAIWGGLALGVALLFFAWDLPRPDAALATTRRPSVTLEAADGRLLATSGDLYGERVRLAELPAYLPAALMAVEDRRFRSHFGLDPMGLARAALANWRAGRVVQGGSTLTQQLAKNLFLTPERNLRRKVQEALLALWLERRFTKDQLLEIYLNRVYLGGGAFGVDAAARLYFGVPAARVTLWQAAILAGLPKAPSRLNPRAAPEAAMRRGADVLAAMADAGLITPRRAAEEAERMSLPRRPSGDAGWFADWVQDDLAEDYPGTGDLVLRTTLDLRAQAAVEARLEALLAGPGVAAHVGQGAVVVLDARDGAVRAMAGGRAYRQSPFNRATTARRQPGSAFKPFAFLAALEQGAGPEDRVADTPLSLGRWSPGNGGWRSRGEITLEEALAHSVNTAAVRVMQQGGGARAMAEVAHRLGVQGNFANNASLALGTAEVTLLDMSAAYAAFANGGLRVTPYGVARAEAAERLLAVPRSAPQRVLAPEHAAAMRRMLGAVVRQGTGRAAGVAGLSVAGKTGTTQDFRDAWFIGFADSLVIGIWLGNDDGSPMESVSGGSLPARLFHDILEELRP
ncbi:transglycosylase domain-containing protein [Pseudoroseomonas cervicalis]|uniref:transglycosylase domain-containing protein n=1 Tax=Teichococcus cervicalis TaxID=204525 RepID=UPI0027840FC0|nr:PBP1A family penicillin-binding protein [Pseudoroseomonas cervicalis]MDQ1080843.1 penicillin-binding protein 1A [Pseudoroseomonas cervicalis]